jgi:hypothetical protein
MMFPFLGVGVRLANPPIAMWRLVPGSPACLAGMNGCSPVHNLGGFPDKFAMIVMVKRASKVDPEQGQLCPAGLFPAGKWPVERPSSLAVANPVVRYHIIIISMFDVNTLPPRPCVLIRLVLRATARSLALVMRGFAVRRWRWAGLGRACGVGRLPAMTKAFRVRLGPY